MQQQIAHGHARLGALSPGELGQVVHHGRIERELVLVDRHHGERGRGDHFGERCHVVKRAAVGRSWVVNGQLPNRVDETFTAYRYRKHCTGSGAGRDG